MWTCVKFLLAGLCAAMLCAQTPAEAQSMNAAKQREQAVERLAGGLKFPTVGSVVYEETNFAPFEDFKNYLLDAYPAVRKAMHFELVNGHSMVFRWKGKDPSRKPILFLSHYDVVPVGDADYTPESFVFRLDDPPAEAAAETQVRWDHPPFSGAVADGRIYGRGSLDMKGMLFAIMEAADRLLAEGFQPDQDVWFAFGHDEETGGLNGAAKVAERFKAEGLVFDAVFDEGGLIGLEGAILKSVKRPVAVVGLGEKGFLTLSVKVRGIGGHSSMPPAKSSLVLASEIALLLNERQMPVRMTPPVEALVQKLKAMDPVKTDKKGGGSAERLKALSGLPVSSALTRTTTAITMMRGSEAPNVMSSVAEIVVNFRILHGDDINSVMEHVRNVCTGYDVEISVVGSSREPSGLTPVDSRGFAVISESVKSLYPDAIVVPYISIAGTDSYKYELVSDNVYRFMPVRVNMYEQRTMHNENEYISIENYENMIRYFGNVMRTYGNN